MKKRKGTPLSLYYPSVTGLLGSCHGYRDSRLSVLLTIAHKGGIQLWATMQITLSLSLSISFFLHFLLFTSVCIHIHLPFSSPALPSLSLELPTQQPRCHPPTTTSFFLFGVSILPFIPHFATLLHHTPTSITVGEK